MYCFYSLKGSHIPEHLQEILKRNQQQQKVTSGTIAPATVSIQHIKVTKPSVSMSLYCVYQCQYSFGWSLLWYCFPGRIYKPLFIFTVSSTIVWKLPRSCDLGKLCDCECSSCWRGWWWAVQRRHQRRHWWRLCRRWHQVSRCPVSLFLLLATLSTSPWLHIRNCSLVSDYQCTVHILLAMLCQLFSQIG